MLLKGHRPFGCLVLAMACLWGLGDKIADARSTFTARFAYGTIVGPEIEQSALLLVHYFPGDGEAVLRSEITYDSSLSLKSATSALGSIEVLTPYIIVSYADRPLSRDRVDTLEVTLSTKALERSAWRGEMYSSLDPSGPAAHEAKFHLEVVPPLSLRAEASVEELFPGQQAEVEVTVHNVDRRIVRSLSWSWPSEIRVEDVHGEGLQSPEEKGPYIWQVDLSEGDTATSRWNVNVDPLVEGGLAISGVATSDEIESSPLPDIALSISSRPRARLLQDSSYLPRGERAEVIVRLSNATPERIDVGAFELEIPAIFTDVEVAAPAQFNTEIVSGSNTRVVIEGVGGLGPEQRLDLRIGVTPQKAGRFRWTGNWVPEGRFWKLPLPIDGVVSVAQRATPTLQSATELQSTDEAPSDDRTAQDPRTDLQLLGTALRSSLDEELGSLALPKGTRIYLAPESEGDQNWLVDDALTEALMRKGYTVSVREPEEAPDAAAGKSRAGKMTYRIADSQVVYSPKGGGWNPFSTERQKREAFGDLFLYMELENRVQWASRVSAYAIDEIVGDDASLSGSDVVDRTVIKADRKLVERVLSTGIVGGLLYIFFVP